MTFNKITGSSVGADLSALGEISHISYISPSPHQFVKPHYRVPRPGVAGSPHKVTAYSTETPETPETVKHLK